MQPRFAFEVALDEAAEQLGIDPIEVRRRNFIGENVETVNGQRITSNGFLKCLELVEEASGWKERRGKLGAGRGPSCGRFLCDWSTPAPTQTVRRWMKRAGGGQESGR